MSYTFYDMSKIKTKHGADVCPEFILNSDYTADDVKAIIDQFSKYLDFKTKNNIDYTANFDIDLFLPVNDDAADVMITPYSRKDLITGEETHECAIYAIACGGNTKWVISEVFDLEDVRDYIMGQEKNRAA
jgi:hypothetical protein